MEERIVVICVGLYIKTKSGRYRQVKSLEFLVQGEEENDLKKLNPIIVEDILPKSFPANGIKIFEEKLPNNLFCFRECLEITKQENSKIFVHRGRKYVFMNNVLNRITEKRT